MDTPASLTIVTLGGTIELSMKSASRPSTRKRVEKPRPRMTRELAEARTVAGGKGKFDGVAFLRSLKR
jgi:hypothetical protein